MLNVEEADLAMRDVYKDRALRKTDLTAYMNKEQEVLDGFAEFLAEEHLPDLPKPATDTVFRKAWQDGHHAGFPEVEGIYSDLAELIKVVMLISQ